MMYLFLLSITLLFLPLILMLINIFISKKTFQDREKMSPFECGFDPLSFSHPPFSIHFFMISLIFLIFDIEITMLIPMIFLMMTFNFMFITTSMFFLFILLIGLYIEYSEQSIDWKI